MLSGSCILELFQRECFGKQHSATCASLRNADQSRFSQSLIAQGSEFPLRKPAGFHWDFFLLGITTLLAGIFGVPAPNGGYPQW